MSPTRRSIRFALACGLLASFIGCQDFSRRGGEDVEFEVKILKDAEAVRSRLGERLSGYLAEYEKDFQARKVFLSLEILKYEKGERLSVKGGLSEDTVSISYGGQLAADVPVLYVRKAGPAGTKADVDKLLAGPEKKR